MKQPLLHKEVFLLLLPVFFVLHGYTDNFPAVPLAGAGFLLLKYLAITAALLIIFYFIYKDFRKTAFFVLTLLFLFFFFGAIQDFLKNYAFLFSKYSILLPAVLVLMIASYWFFRKTPFAWNRQVKFINILLLVLILVEIVQLSIKLLQDKTYVAASTAVASCDSCKKPDIYLILADEYSGNKALQDQFNFENTAFENALRSRGFYVVPESSSNYNFTIYSMASLFNMNYLPPLRNHTPDKKSLTTAYGMINDNEFVRVLKANNYNIVNNSFFTFNDQPAATEQSLLVNREGLISSQTLISRMWKDLGYHLVTNLKWKAIDRKLTFTDFRNNEKLLNRLREEANNKTDNPKFVYTHLMMPHYPYYLDKNGEINPLHKVKEGTQHDMSLYLGYLQHSNKIFISVIDSILKQATRPTVIVFMSDHGFREYSSGVPRKYHFMNINAVYGVDSASYYSGVSNVNQFRIISNDLFHSGYPLLKDSTVFQENF